MDCEAERVENEKIHVGEMHKDSTLHARVQLRQSWQCGNKRQPGRNLHGAECFYSVVGGSKPRLAYKIIWGD